VASTDELIRYLEQFLQGQSSDLGLPEPGGPPGHLASAAPEQVQAAMLGLGKLHPELVPHLALGDDPGDLQGALGQLSGIPSEALADYVPSFDDAGAAAFGAIDGELGGVLGGALDDTGIPIGAAGSAFEDLASGDYEKAGIEAGVTGLDVGAAALGLPGVDGDVGVITDLIDGNTDSLGRDTETAAIETGTSIAFAAAGSIIGPEGTIAGAAIGDFVGHAIAPSVEAAVSDTWDTATNIVDDTASAFSDVGDDLSDGDFGGAIGDVATGAIDVAGDVVTGAVDVAGDAVEGVVDVVTEVADVATSAVDGVADVATSVVDDVADVASSAVDDVEDFLGL
jgi:hypothetical protein